MSPETTSPDTPLACPPPAKKIMRFERGELPLFVLQQLADYGALRRPQLTEAAFTVKATKLHKQRINGTLTILKEKGYVKERGPMRLYTFSITKEGRAFLRAERKEPVPNKKERRPDLIVG